MTPPPPVAGPPTGPATIVLEPSGESPSEPDFVADAPLVAFDAFLPDQRVHGWVRLTADRLTDLLNAQPSVVLVNAQLEHLSTGRMEWHDELVLDRDRLLAVRAGGPRGDPAHRQRLRLHPLLVQSGPFHASGFLHAPPGIDPYADVVGRPPMVPLSLGCLEYWVNGERRSQWTGTILFHHGLVDTMQVVAEEDLSSGEDLPSIAAR